MPALEHNWVNVTTWALQDWRAALGVFWERYYQEGLWSPMANPIAFNRAHASLHFARANYRHRVLSWFWKLCVPLRLGHCVPDTVAELLAEEWDLKTSGVPDIAPARQVFTG